MYRKNVSGQFICVQLVLAASGAAATGLTPSARRCIDGTFAAGGGSFTEDTGTGAYKYALAQADTNGNDISIIVTATGAIPVCVNFVTTAADPTDGVRLGLTALPNAAAGATGGLPTGDSAGKVALQADQAVNATKFAGQTITAAAGVTLPSEVASPTNITGGTITTATNLTNLPSIPSNWLTAAGIAATALNGKGDWATAANVPTADANADALLDRTAGVETNRTLRQAMRLMLAALAGKLSGADTTTVTIRDTNDSTNRIIATVDANGNRSTITLNAG